MESASTYSVQHSFVLDGRGVVLVPEPPIDGTTFIAGDILTIDCPSGAESVETIKSIEILSSREKSTWAIVVAGNPKNIQIPPGSTFCISNRDVTNENMAHAVNAIRQHGHESVDYPAIKQYIEHHLDELDDAYWLSHTDTDNPSSDDVLEIMVADTTWSDNGDTIVDCTLPGGVTNYLLSVRLNASGQCTGIEMES